MENDSGWLPTKKYSGGHWTENDSRGHQMKYNSSETAMVDSCVLSARL